MKQELIRDLGDGLIVRRSTRADADALAAFNGQIHARPEAREPDAGITAWTRDLLSQPHPTFHLDDFTIVEDTRTGAIVSSLNLISQTWSYDGIPFGVGRPELVGTLPPYRQRGLVRTQFDEIHRWSAERGEKVQSITGIPYFYRQFGYEMALTLHGGRIGEKSDVPRLKEGETDPYRVRPATNADLRFIATIYDAAAQRYLVTCARNEAIWTYELRGRSAANGCRHQLCVVETADGKPVGYLAHRPLLVRDRSIFLTDYELASGVSWLAVTPSVVRYLEAIGEDYARQTGQGEFGAFDLSLGPEHPAYDVLGNRLPRTYPPYAWYLRVAEVSDFLRLVAPALERRLERSVAVGHSGEVKIGFYRSGVRLTFERGRLTGVDDWKQTSAEISDARFPDLTFLQLLFGYRSLDELQHAFSDCQVPNNDARVILKAIFPKSPSRVWPVA